MGASEQQLEEVLEALEKGLSVDQILGRYPGLESELKPFLTTAATLSEFRVAHSKKGLVRSRKRMLEAAAAMRAGQGSTRGRSGWWRRLGLGLASAVLALVLLAVGLTSFSSSAVPGDVLYGSKRAFESFQMTFTSDPADREALSAQMGRERLREVESLLREGREAEVEFGGRISSVEEASLVVGGLPVRIDEETQVNGKLVTGGMAEVEGLTRDGMVLAKRINIESGDEAPPVPDAAKPEPGVEKRPFAGPTPSDTPEPTPTASPTPSPSPTATSSPTPSATPSPTSTLQDEPIGDDSNDNDADDDAGTGDGAGNDNDNEGDDDSANSNDSDDDNSNSNDSDDDNSNSNESDDGDGNDNDNDDESEDGGGSNNGRGGGNDNERDD